METSVSTAKLPFREIADNADDVLFLVDAASHRLVYVSPAYAAIWGRSCESLHADPESWLEAVHPDDRETVRASLGEPVTQERSAPCEFRIACPDGSLRSIEARRFSVRDDAGTTTGIATIARDITERTRIVHALHESALRFDGVVASAMDAIVSVDAQQRIILANAAAERMFGHSASEMLGQPLGVLIPERLRAGHADHVASFGRSGVTSRRMGALRTVHGLRRNGEEFPIEASISRHESAGLTFYTAILRDDSERQRAQERIDRLHRVYTVLSAINSLIVRASHRDRLFEEACRIAVTLGDYDVAWIGVVDRDAMKIEPLALAGGEPDFLARIRDSYPLLDDAQAKGTMVAHAVQEKRALVSNQLQGDARVLYAKDRIAEGIASKAVLPLIVADEVIGVFVLHAREPGRFDEDEMRLLLELAGDIAFAVDHIRKVDQLQYLAYYDPMTGLANQALFEERLRSQILSENGECQRIAVFALDIERFRSVNEAMGRRAGDELLRMIARRFRDSNDGDDHRFARIGSDRFAIFAPGMGTPEDVGRYLEQRLELNFHRPFHIAEGEVQVAVKVGVALFPDDDSDVDALLRDAEAALKKAKASGQRYLFFSQSMTERVAEHLSLETRLHHALDNEEFVLHYQPKVSLATGKLTGAEALIRWNDPRSGLVAPGAFIPILEETGLIHDVGRWAMRKAIADYLRWRDAGLPAVRIAVNVSPLQLRDKNFSVEVAGALAIDAQAAAGLEIEITESVIMEDVKHNIAILRAIRAMGATIAIDDFGTGFSSLSYLSKLPIDTLKIDRAFVVDMTSGPDGLSLVSTIINLAHSMKFKVVAEGVETEEQERLLRLLRCDDMQGYLFGRPVPAEIFEEKFLIPDAPTL